MAAAAIALALVVALRMAMTAARVAGRLLLRHFHWYWTLPTIASKVVVALIDALALVVLDHLVPLPHLLRTAVLTTAGIVLATVFLSAILFHSGPRRIQ